MRAFVLTRDGGSDAMEFRSVPRPSPGPGEVLIQVYAAGLNPIDFKIGKGMMGLIYRHPLPITAGSELSGVVVAKGSGVTRLAEGDRVFTRVDKRRLGAFADFAVVREELVAKMPSSVDFTTAAGVPLAGLTALQGLRDELRGTRGQNIFISGGSGGVGTFAIQLGKWLGAHIATTASARGEAMVRTILDSKRDERLCTYTPFTQASTDCTLRHAWVLSVTRGNAVGRVSPHLPYQVLLHRSCVPERGRPSVDIAATGLW